MVKFTNVSKETFVQLEHHFSKEPDMKIGIIKNIVPACVFIYLKDEVIARAHLPRTNSDKDLYESEYVVRNDILDKYLLTKYLP